MNLFFSLPLLHRLLPLLLLLPPGAAAQQRLAGRLSDAESGEPVAGATVYIDGTQQRVASGSDGSFVLEGAPLKGTLVLTHVGYEKASVELQAFRDPLQLALTRRAAELDAVQVKGKGAGSWKKWGRLFTEYFIGGNEVTRDCHLRNPGVLRFYYDAAAGTMKAFARAPLVLENEVLGYRVRIDLDVFTYSFRSGYFSYSISRYCEPIEPPDAATAQRYAAGRLLAYRGSRMQFTRALFDTSLAQQGFRLYRYRGRVNGERARVQALLLEQGGHNGGATDLRAFGPDSARYYSRMMAAPAYYFEDTLSIGLSARWAAPAADQHTFRFGPDSLLLYYETPAAAQPADGQLQRIVRRRVAGINEGYAFLPEVRGGQYTLLFLRPDSVLSVQANGFVNNPASLFTEGYFAGRRSAYDLPWDYEPAADERLLRAAQVRPAR